MSAEHLGERPTPRPRADLSSAFAPPDRASRLGGKLTRAPRPSVTKEPRGEDSAAAEPAAAPPAPPRPDKQEAATESAEETPAPPRDPPAASRSLRRGRSAASQTRQRNAEGGTTTTIVYLPGEVLDLLRQHRLRTGCTYTDMVLDALDATHPRLGELLAVTERAPARPAGSLFTGSDRSRSVAAQPKAQITLRPRSGDAEVIDALARKHGTNRSKLVTVALTAHLTD